MNEPDPRAKLEPFQAPGVWQLNEDDQGYHDDLAFTYRRASGGDG